MKRIGFLLMASTLLVACSGTDENSTETTGATTDATVSREGLQTEIKNLEDSLFKVIPEVPKDLYDLAISKNLQYVDHFPEDAYSAECLDRVQGYFSQLQKYKKAVIYTDTLLSRFPEYKNKKFLMYNRATSLDLLRDTARARQAYVEYLETFPNLPDAEREEIEELIKLVPYSFEERIEMMN